MDLLPLALPGCFELRPRVLKDERGCFVKTFHRDVFRAHGLVTEFAEEYYSSSRRGVIRGLHFQTPPHEHTKIVYCVSGSVTDAVVDLRKGSPAFGQHVLLELSADKANMVYLPPGVAHGFCVRSETALLMYKVTTVYAPHHDAGIRWNSAGIPWDVREPILSPRDLSFPTFADFASPFIYREGSA